MGGKGAGIHVFGMPSGFGFSRGNAGLPIRWFALLPFLYLEPKHIFRGQKMPEFCMALARFKEDFSQPPKG